MSVESKPNKSILLWLRGDRLQYDIQFGNVCFTFLVLDNVTDFDRIVQIHLTPFS